MCEQRVRFLAKVLDRIEVQESRLLVWGIVDVSFQSNELNTLISPLIDEPLGDGITDFFETDEVIQALLDLRWIVQVDLADGQIRYRSRMAETVRLLQRLRQLFPRHLKQPNGWQSAPTLVADFRFKRRPRQYPKRNISPETVHEIITASINNQAILNGITAIVGNRSLSGFQVRATETILRSIESRESTASIVTAGTGSGKTMAFYLPALASITRHHLTGDGLPWVKVIGIYPRTELLKDQLQEVIRRLVSLMVSLRTQNHNVSIRVGALYADIPREAQWCQWPKLGNDFICPSLKCIECNGQMIWNHVDHANSVEQLSCHQCGWSVAGDIFPLTRASLVTKLPDILITTTEMLNQRLSDNYMNCLFGIGARATRPPELVLLDEVHTYEGRYGAQVAYLLRRWKQLVNTHLRFVGLSATLREAKTFFSHLIGEPETRVETIAPNTDELETEGAEYMLALRGDPVSRTALLSTTIQTCMLLQRCLDPRAANPAESISLGAFGQRTFVFTDDLDVTNRLYFYLLNAEGRTSQGAPDLVRAPNGGLAVLRTSDASISRYKGGQDWRACEEIGHGLQNRLNIERVSSQDRGVDATADVIVATAALEVGFDDPVVGAVVQHKAPRGMASFLQRKGRAGRTRGMRPWTVVVLSDYGRDRLAYQAYDLLFDPELPARTLPLSNRYITRMQAVFASIDYLGTLLQNAANGSVWYDLASPHQGPRIDYLKNKIRNIMESENGLKELKSYLGRALDVPDDEVSALLWEFPRPLMTTVFPTALRRLNTGWMAFGNPAQDIQVKNNPLPDFVPATLFSDLNLAEVQISLPNNSRNSMPIISALNEFAPGRVSHRFGVHYQAERHWISPDLGELDEFGTYFPLGQFSYIHNGENIHLPVYRPTTLKPSLVPWNISDTSKSSLVWHTQFVPINEPTWLDAPLGSTWSNRVPRLGFFTHSRQTPVEVRRFASGAKAEVGIAPGQRQIIHSEFHREGNPAGLGIVFPADGVLFEIKIPDFILENLQENTEKTRAIRTERFFNAAWKGEVLSEVQSPFMRDWLAHIFISAITYEAIQVDCSLETAIQNITNGHGIITLNTVLDILFQSLAYQPEDEAEQPAQDTLRQDLDGLIAQPEIISELEQLARYLWEPITDEWQAWINQVYQCTIGAALLQTIGDLCPTINLEDLLLDLGRGFNARPHLASVDENHAEVWITEKSPGGNGLIEEFMRQYSEDPRRFFSMVRACLEMGEFELIDHQLGKLLSSLAAGNNEITNIVNQLRAGNEVDTMAATTSLLRRTLLHNGFSPFHGFMVSVGNRILRPGTNAATDSYLAQAIQNWNEQESRLGIEIDLRVICFWLSQQADINMIMNIGAVPDNELQAWRMNAIYGVLWARGRFIRSSALQTRNLYQELPPMERLLVIDTVVDERQRISIETPQWIDEVHSKLAQGLLVTLSCTTENRDNLGSAIHALITHPIESGYLRTYARLQGVRQTKDLLEADFELLEAVQ